MTVTVLPTQPCSRGNAGRVSGAPEARSAQLLSTCVSQDKGIGWRRRTWLIFHCSAGGENAFYKGCYSMPPVIKTVVSNSAFLKSESPSLSEASGNPSESLLATTAPPGGQGRDNTTCPRRALERLPDPPHLPVTGGRSCLCSPCSTSGVESAEPGSAGMLPLPASPGDGTGAPANVLTLVPETTASSVTL